MHAVGVCMHACFLPYVCTCSTSMIDLKVTALEPHIMLLSDHMYLMVAFCNDSMHVYYILIAACTYIHKHKQEQYTFTTNVTAHHLCD